MGTAQRKMVPREHGAYAELLFPIAAVLLGGSPTAPTWLLAIGAVACFLANEPLLVLYGQRGSRVKREDNDRAKRALVVFSLVALGTGVAGLVLAPTAVQYAVGIPLLLGMGLVMLAIQGLERSMFGEVLAAATLSSVAIPLGLSAGMGLTATLAVALIWLVTSLLGTAVVRLTVARTKVKTEHDGRRVRMKQALLVSACLMVMAVGVAAPYGSRVGLWVLAAALPVAVVVFAMAVLQPTARRLRLMGWSLVAANLCSLIAVVTTLKIIQDFNAVEPTLPFPMF
ncbi:MAG: YwiC-like family protein [Polyangiales bacterium]